MTSEEAADKQEVYAFDRRKKALTVAIGNMRMGAHIASLYCNKRLWAPGAETQWDNVKSDVESLLIRIQEIELKVVSIIGPIARDSGDKE